MLNFQLKIAGLNMNKLLDCLASIWVLLGELCSLVTSRLQNFSWEHLFIEYTVVVPSSCIVTQGVKILIESMEWESRRCESLFFMMVGTGFPWPFVFYVAWTFLLAIAHKYGPLQATSFPLPAILLVQYACNVCAVLLWFSFAYVM